MAYIDSILLNNEKVLYKVQLSKLSFWLYYLIGIICILIGIFVPNIIILGFGIAYCIIPTVEILTTEMYVTTSRVIHKKGLVARRTNEQFLNKIESANVDQDILGRIFNYGAISINGTGGNRAIFKNISNPLSLTKEINNYLHQEPNKN